jgi:hypothetical protein
MTLHEALAVGEHHADHAHYGGKAENVQCKRRERHVIHTLLRQDVTGLKEL